MQHQMIEAKEGILFFETTINISKEVYQKISEAAAKYHISRSRLITMLIEYLVSREKIPASTRGTVQYQQRQAKDQWKTLHVVLPAHVHDFFDDVRKLWKMSLSYLVAMVAEKFLTQMDELLKNASADKYWHGCHTIIHFIKNELHYILCCWGIPPDPPEIQL